ncbi:hypothetical protein CYMTET_17977 [Cymbomonas tetramitiformis]|uniref:Choline transporter-like protein n=1 Tax=Cymbomonas tetramitiformis TaxID=36881 RepID=A0AAE0G905_9CHLO|nr:hypothetical protein CYMTET_17977 [Cymbomonas tetramitiformis]
MQTELSRINTEDPETGLLDSHWDEHADDMRTSLPGGRGKSVSPKGPEPFEPEAFQRRNEQTFTALFCAHLLLGALLVALLSLGGTFENAFFADSDDTSNSAGPGTWLLAQAAIVSCSLLCATFCACAAIHILQAAPDSVLQGALAGAPVLSALFSIILVADGVYGLGIVFGAMACLAAASMHAMAPSLPLLEITFSIAAKGMGTQPGVTVLAYAAVMAQAMFQGVLLLLLMVCMEAKLYPIVVYLCFSSYWVGEVVRNLLRVSVAGALARWYCMGPYSSPNCIVPAFAAAQGACFGSVCYGSAITPLVGMVHSTISSLARTIMCGKASGGDALGLIQRFNKFAFVNCALYGSPTPPSALPLPDPVYSP